MLQDKNDVVKINRAIGEYHRSTCLRFIPRRPNDKDFIIIENGSTGCWSSIGELYILQFFFDFFIVHKTFKKISF